jgi:alanine racemase
MTGQSQPATRPAVRPPPPITPDTARAWIDVDLGALVRNGRSLARRAGVPLLPMVKADGYGLGAVAVARALEALEPWGYGVAAVEEGRELRAAGIARRILVTTPLLPAELDAVAALGLTPALHRAADVRRWAATGRPWHLSIDTGMHRAGVRWDLVGELRDAVAECPPEGAFTHFHSAERGDGSAARQAARFREALAALPARPPLLHAENSAAIERTTGSPWNLARPGVFLYGVESDAGVPVEPVAALRARVVDVRTVPDGETVSYTGSWRAIGDRRVATIAAGYADGYRRALSNRGTALLHGRRVPVVGVVTMDMTMLDVTDVPCEVGDVATLLGRDGDAELTIREVALAAEMMSPYELLTGLRARPPRRYHGAGA